MPIVSIGAIDDRETCFCGIEIAAMGWNAICDWYIKGTAGRYVAVDRVSFQVRPGEFFGLLGANGVGQKTSLRIVATMLRSTSGTVRVGGYDVEESSADVRRRIGFVSNDTAIEDRMTAQELLTFLGILNRLSGEHLRQRTESLIHDLKATGKCLIFSTHIRSEVEKLCDRMAVMLWNRLLPILFPLSIMVSAVALGLSAVARSSEEEQYHLMPMRMMVIAFVFRNDPFGDPGDRGNVYPKHADRFAFADLECVAVFGRARIRTRSGLYVIDALGDDCLSELRIRGGFDASADVSNGFDTLD